MDVYLNHLPSAYSSSNSVSKEIYYAAIGGTFPLRQCK